MCDRESHVTQVRRTVTTATESNRDARAAARGERAMDDEVEEIVDGVLASVPELLSNVCDRDGILSGLLSYGACSVAALHSSFDADYAGVKSAIGSAAKPALVAMLKSAVVQASSAAAQPATPAGQNFETPAGSGTRPGARRGGGSACVAPRS